MALLHPIIYFAIILIELVFVIFLASYLLSLIYSTIMGSPYVPIRRKKIREILKEADLKQNKKFIDIGCGDGRVVKEAVQTFNVKGTGIDINPIILYKAKFI